MQPNCVTAVSEAIGRSITDAEQKKISDAITQAMRDIAAKDPNAWRGKSADERLVDAATLAGQRLVAEQAKKAQRMALQILAINRLEQYLAQSPGSKFDALDRAIAFKADATGSVMSVETQAMAIERDALRQMVDTLEATNPKFFGLIENPEGVRAIVREIFGEATGIKEAAEGAKQFKAIAEQLRSRFNRGGGDVGQLDDWGLPHHHSQLLVAKAGKEAWVNATLPRLNRARYVKPDGSAMNDVELRDFLGNAWTTIATGGANKAEPGKFRGNGMRANRGNESRQIHFKDADSYLDYQAEFGERTLYEVMVGHISGVSKDIAMVETFGPNPDNTFRLMRDKVVNEAILADPVNEGRYEKRGGDLEKLYDFVAGRHMTAASKPLAEGFDTLRNWLVASRLGSAVVSALSDEPTMYLTARINKLPAMRLMANELAALNPANPMEKRMALRAGLAMNTMLSSLNRWGNDNLGSGVTSRIATSTLRASGLSAITEARRRAFGVTMMSSIGQVVRDFDSLSALDAADLRILNSKGITDADWAVWRAARQEDWGGGNDTMLTPEAIYRVPDEAIDAALDPEFQRVRGEADAQMAELDARNVQEQEWLTKRRSRYAEAQQQAADTIQQFRASKDAGLKQAADALQARADLLRARVEEAEVRADIEGYLRAEGAQGRVRGFLEAVEEGAAVDRQIVSKRVQADRRSDAIIDQYQAAPAIGERANALVQRYGREVAGRAEALGQRQGSAKRRIVELDARIRELERTAGKAVDERAEKLGRKLGEHRTELEEFAKKSAERVRRRKFVMDRLDSSVKPAMAEARIKAREAAATRLLGAVLEETNMAVIEPGARERTMMMAGQQRGTWKGEIVRSVFLFKSFPVSMIAKHWTRGMSMQTGGGKAAYLATLLAGTTVFGMAALQINELLQGKDPRAMNPAAEGGVKNWMAAMLKGGSLGLYGDFLFSDATQYGNSRLGAMLGPVAGLTEDTMNLTVGNLLEAGRGDKTNVGAELVRFAKSNTPGANLWYAKAAFDRLVFNQLQEYFSPGYLRKMKRRAKKEFGQSYWWEPGESAPDRAPDLEKAIEE